MRRKQPFKHHRFPALIILSAVRMYLRYPLSYQDVADLLGERGVDVDRSTVFRWVQKFGPELAKRTESHLRRARAPITGKPLLLLQTNGQSQQSNLTRSSLGY